MTANQDTAKQNDLGTHTEARHLDIAALIAKATNALETGQPNLAILYMAKATRDARALRLSIRRERIAAGGADGFIAAVDVVCAAAEDLVAAVVGAFAPIFSVFASARGAGRSDFALAGEA